MAMVRCRECRREISNKAEKCPQCGAPVKTKGVSFGTGLLVLVIGGGTIYLLAKNEMDKSSPEGRKAAARLAEQQESERQAATQAAQSERQAAQAQIDRATVLTAGNIILRYEGNEVAADSDLKNKVFKVTGVVDRVGKDISDKSYVILKPYDTYSGLRSVQCFFDDSHIPELSAITPGQTLVIFGKCHGLMMNVLMENCVITPK